MTESTGRWRILIAAASLIGLGVVLGVSADRVVRLHGATGIIEFSEVHHDPVGVIDRFVELRTEQRTRIARIIETRQAHVDRAWHDARARINATVDSVVNEIAAELDPDQAEVFRRGADELHRTGRLRHH